MKKALIIIVSVLLSLLLLAAGLIWIGNLEMDNYEYDAPEKIRSSRINTALLQRLEEGFTIARVIALTSRE